MLPNQPSRTLLGTAIRRATHQVLDTPVIFDDPIALQVLPEASDSTVIAGLAADGVPDPVLLRSLFAMRSRFAEDCLADAAARGVRQYLMLGAGLDTFPWRQPDFARNMRLFAADHPASLTFAQERFTSRGLSKPPNLTRVPVDLEQGGLAESVVAHGFDPALPTFCSMLGVAQYLNAEASNAVLAFASSLPKDSEIVFSFALPDDALRGYDLKAITLSMKFTGAMGEAWRTRLRPEELVALLNYLGFGHVFHLTPELAQQLYFADRRDSLRAVSWEQMIAAVV